MDLVYDPKTKTWGPGYKVEIFFDSEEQRDEFEKALHAGGLEPARPHGKWTTFWGGFGHDQGIRYRCSNCNDVTDDDSKYCPYCGARMDLKAPPHKTGPFQYDSPVWLFCQ